MMVRVIVPGVDSGRGGTAALCDDSHLVHQPSAAQPETALVTSFSPQIIS